MIQLITFLAFFILFSSTAFADTITEYFTYKANHIDFAACETEGTVLVRGVLYVWHGGRCQKADVQCQYGIGHRNNCLTPCQSIAADSKHWGLGNRVYIPAYQGKLCPFTGRRMDGNFVVSDVGAWIKGKRRFDVFMGVCVSQSGGVCNDYDRRGRFDFQRELLRAAEKKSGRSKSHRQKLRP